MGRALFEAAMPQKKITYFDFPDTHISSAELGEITQHLHQYAHVVVFHGSFRSFIDQHPVLSRVSGEERALGEAARAAVSYIFEPSLEEVLIFFEGQMFGSIFEQTIHESDLAKYAARMFFILGGFGKAEGAGIDASYSVMQRK